jgi:hypothetical protein
MRHLCVTRSVGMLWTLVCATAVAGDLPASLTMTNSKLGTFEVVSHRMEPVGAGAAAGGLVGIAIQSSMHSSRDEAMKKRLLQAYPEASCSPALLDAFAERVRASGAFPLESTGKPAITVDIEIDECGVHLADTTVGEYASYVYLKLKVKPATGAAWNESIQVSGRNRYDFEEFVNQPGLAKSEMEDTLKRAGTRAADKIIYKK